MNSPPNDDITHLVRFETETRYYVALLQVDLFDEWVVSRAWGGKASRLGQQRSDLCASREAGLALIEQVRKRRLKRGYKEIGT